MLKKRICMIMAAIILCLMLSTPARAIDTSMSFSFGLLVDGQSTKEVRTGDIITVTLRLHRTDSTEPYTMYAMQDEIRYDSTFFELVEDSTVNGSGIVSTDIAMVDRYREFYMNFLSMSGGSQWDADMLIGSIQLRVIGKSGVTQITNQDYLVSLQDGSDSYCCDAGDVTVILTTDCMVRFMTNGGNEIPDQTVQYGEKVVRPEDPVREGFRFAGWYADINLTDVWDFERDTVQGNMSLYAKWVADDASEPMPDDDAESSECMWWLLLLLLLFVMLYLVKKRTEKFDSFSKRKGNKDGKN